MARATRMAAVAMLAASVLAACGDTGDEAGDRAGDRAGTAAGSGASASSSSAPPPGPPPTAGSTASTAAPSTAPSTATVPPAPAGGPVTLEVATVADGLDVPWAIAFLPDGRALVSERDTGRVLAVGGNGSVSEVQQLDSVAGGEGGLLGLAVSPRYATDGLVYAYYSSGSDNRVVRFRLGGEVEPVFTGIPRASVHNGGRIAFGPDGYLYVGTGDAAQSSRSQDPGSPAGKILRITGDGQPAPDNPEAGNPMYSLGHRNVQGLDWDAEGRLFATEFGANAADEINLITPGGNYGWPEVEGSGGGSAYVEPLVTYDPSEASPSGAALLKDSALTPWNGDLLVGALRGKRLLRVDVAGTRVVGTEHLLEGQYGRLRAVTQAPDGSVWVSTSNTDGRGEPAAGDDRILRLTPRVG